MEHNGSNNGLATIQPTAVQMQLRDNYMPVMDIDDILKRHSMLLRFREEVLREGTDFGKIPGTGDKPTLLKPGAEKLCTLFGLTTRFAIVEKIEDWDGSQHGGEPFLYYWYRCSLFRGAHLIAEADGSANSHESKYRYRNSERVCPECQAPAIKRSKYPPRDEPDEKPGWYCFSKAGGCGANFYADEPLIVNQQVGKKPNPDIADVANTLLKMAQKRSLVAAALIGVNASEFFTQDIEDFAHTDSQSAAPVVEDEVVEPHQPQAKTAQLATNDEVDAYFKQREKALEIGLEGIPGSLSYGCTSAKLAKRSALLAEAFRKAQPEVASEPVAEQPVQPTLPASDEMMTDAQRRSIEVLGKRLYGESFDVNGGDKPLSEVTKAEASATIDRYRAELAQNGGHPVQPPPVAKPDAQPPTKLDQIGQNVGATPEYDEFLSAVTEMSYPWQNDDDVHNLENALTHELQVLTVATEMSAQQWYEAAGLLRQGLLTK